MIEKTELFDRGLFSGIIGWFNADNYGEFFVTIRSALVKNNKLYAYAGCGIVEGSDPKEEYEEAQLKLKPILSLLIMLIKINRNYFWANIFLISWLSVVLNMLVFRRDQEVRLSRMHFRKIKN